MGWAGFNCSLPHKVAVIDHLDGLGAVGRGHRRGQHRRRHRRRARRPQHRRPGLRRVAAHRRRPGRAARRRPRRRGGRRARSRSRRRSPGGSVTVVNRNERRGEELARVVTAGTGVPTRLTCPGTGTYAVPGGADVVVNATSIGLRRRRGPASTSTSTPCAAASWSPTSSSHRRARRSCGPRRQRGATTLDGLGMLVGQGALAVRHCGPASSPTARSCGPPRPGRWASSSSPVTAGFARNGGPGATVSASPRRSSDESAARGDRKRNR